MNELKETQLKIEKECNKNLLWTRIYTELKSADVVMNMVNTAGGNPKILTKILAVMAVYKRLSVDVLPAIIWKPTGKYTLDEVLKNIELAISKELIRFDYNRDQFIVRFTLDEKAQSEIDALQYPLPMLVEPRLIKHNQSSGYLLKDKQSVLLNNNSTKKDVDLDHLNLMNQTAFSINETVLAKVKNSWKADGEMSMRQLERFNRYAKWSQDLMLKNGNKFYFSHRYDYRGRTYCEGYYLNYQGNDYCKSILEFTNKELISD